MVALSSDVSVLLLVLLLVVLFPFSNAAAALYLARTPNCKLDIDHPAWEYGLKQFVWYFLGIPISDLGFASPDAGERAIAGGILIALFSLLALVIARNVLRAMIVNTFNEMKHKAELNFKGRQAEDVEHYSNCPLLPGELFLCLLPGMVTGWLLSLCNLGCKPGSSFGARRCFPWTLPCFAPQPESYQAVRFAMDRALVELTRGKAATLETATEGVRRMASTHLGRMMQPSAETVRDIVKAEIGAEAMNLDAKVEELDAKVEALNSKVASLGATLDAQNSALQAILAQLQRRPESTLTTPTTLV